MEIALSLVFTACLFVVVNELSLFMVAGKLANRKELSIVERLGEERVGVNRYNDRIVHLGKRGDIYVSHYGIFPGILSYYHVQFDMESDYSRRIPIWSKTHRKVRGFYRQVKREKMLQKA